MWYAETIREIAAKQGRIGYSPRLIEAWMRSEHGTLDALTPEQFREEVEVACQLIDRNPALLGDAGPVVRAVGGVMQTQNREWGFYGTMARESTVPDELWDEAMDALTDPDGQFRLGPEIARDLLDSTWGRHFADECVGSHPRRILRDLAKDSRWMRSTLRVLEAIGLARKDSGTNR